MVGSIGASAAKLPMTSTLILQGDDEADLQRATQLLLDGALVAIPTETVYGLAARSDAPTSVDAIYAVKGRPSTRPLSVLVRDFDATAQLWESGVWLEPARILAQNFWPGALTIVCPARSGLPSPLLGNSPNVGVRSPQHAIALELLRRVGVPLAAPSANPSEAPSPTSASAVEAALAGRIDAIVDGGPSSGGVESTIIALTGDGASLIRSGALSIEQVNAVLPPDWQIVAPDSAGASSRLESAPAAAAQSIEVYVNGRWHVWESEDLDTLIASLHQRLSELSAAERHGSRWRAGSALRADRRFAGVCHVLDRYFRSDLR